MVFEIRSARTLEDIDARLKDSAARHKFGVLAVHDLQAKMKEKGVDYGKACVVYEVCNPHQAKVVLEGNPAISSALPCRVSVIGEAGAYRITTLRPTALIDMFTAPASVREVARQVENDLLAMMRDAA